ncbi:MAG: hypothetical protein IKQ57_02545, partial [Candidatus Methanomethylophilaceae archaeon]|nr:hypothetical protein [Candidatus Methanomethylophilaceae archaeon]
SKATNGPKNAFERRAKLATSLDNAFFGDSELCSIWLMLRDRVLDEPTGPQDVVRPRSRRKVERRL